MIKKIDMKTIITSILVILVYFAWPYFINTVLNSFSVNYNFKILLMFLSNFLLLIAIAFIYNESLKKDYKDFKRNHHKYMAKCFKIFIVGLVLFVLVNVLISVIFDIFNINYNNLFRFNEVYLNEPILFIVLNFIYYPIIEELVFKKTLKEILKNKWVFIILSGLINACFIRLFFFQNKFDLIYIIPEAILLISFSYMYYKFDNIIVPIIYRMIYAILPSVVILLNVLELI